MDKKHVWFWMMVFFLFSFLVTTEPIYAQQQEDNILEKDNVKHQTSNTAAMPENDKDVLDNLVKRFESEQKVLESRFQVLLEEKKPTGT